MEAEIGGERKPLVLDFTPEDFDAIEFGTVGWQPVQRDALSKPVVDTGLKGAAGVDGGVVQNNEAKLFGLRGLGGESIQHGNDSR